MSHFSVLVVVDNVEQIEPALQPYHEYECTGTKDEYVTWVDETDEIKQDYEKQSVEREDKEEFLKNYPNLDTFASDYYGADKKDDGTYGRMTNPNKKWDWWQVGGRWSGLLRTKNGAGEKGESGVMGSQYSEHGVDICRVGELDLDTMEAVAREHWAKAWEDCATDDLNEKAKEFIYGIPPGMTKEEYVNRPYTFSTFALVMDSKWYEKGEMGWWGMVADEKEDDKWQEEFTNLVRGLPEDKIIAVVDCHI